MKDIFIYGDSNVWGKNFAGERIKYHLRWVNRLKQSLKSNYIISANGVSGRVAGDFRSDKPEKNGKSSFLRLYNQNNQPEIVLIALGTNDLQNKYNRTIQDIINDLIWYKSAAPNSTVIYIIPPNFDTGTASGKEFTDKSATKLQQLITRKNELGKTIEIGNLDLSDGLHLSNLGHKLMAKIVKQYLVNIQ